MQFSINLRALVHFLKLRLDKSAHFTIRDISYKMFKALPNKYQELILSDEKIKKDIENIEKKEI
jgi:thymidylate synthase ThyX